MQSTEITNCFLNTSTKNPAVCHVLYPGYTKAVDAQRKRTADLRDEVEQQRAFDDQVIQYKDQLVKEVNELKAEIQQLKQGH